MAVGVHNLGLGGQDLMSRIGAENLPITTSRENPTFKSKVRLVIDRYSPSAGDIGYPLDPDVTSCDSYEQARGRVRDRRSYLQSMGHRITSIAFESWNGRGYVVKGRGNQRADVRYS